MMMMMISSLSGLVCQHHRNESNSGIKYEVKENERKEIFKRIEIALYDRQQNKDCLHRLLQFI